MRGGSCGSSMPGDCGSTRPSRFGFRYTGTPASSAWATIRATHLNGGANAATGPSGCSVGALSANHDPIEHRQIGELKLLEHGLQAEPSDSDVRDLSKGRFGDLDPMLPIDGGPEPRRPWSLEFQVALRKLGQHQVLPLGIGDAGRVDLFDPRAWHPLSVQVRHAAHEHTPQTCIRLSLSRYDRVGWSLATVPRETRV